MWKAFQIFHGLCGFSFQIRPELQTPERPRARRRGPAPCGGDVLHAGVKPSASLSDK